MLVEYDQREDVAILTLNDPAKRNALSRALIAALREALVRSRREGARAVVIAAEGRVFCAGANIDDLRAGWMESADPETDPTRFFYELIREPRVVIAAVQGLAAGGGFELTLACDLVLAGPDAAFVCPELAHGVIPPTGLALLARSTGRRKALELLLTRRKIGLEEAQSLGLVNSVAGHGDIVVAAVELARSIVRSVPPGALGVAKRYFNEFQHLDWERVVASSADVPAEEWGEGLVAFAEKRAPDYDRFWLASLSRAGGGE